MEQDFMIYFNIKSVKPVYTSMPNIMYNYNGAPTTTYINNNYGEETFDESITQISATNIRKEMNLGK